MSQNYISTPVTTNGVESFISGTQVIVGKRSSGLSNPLPVSTPNGGHVQCSPLKRDSINNLNLDNRRFTQKPTAQQLTASVPQSAFAAAAGNRAMKPVPIRQQDEGPGSRSSLVVPNYAGRDFQLQLNATQPSDEYYQYPKVGKSEVGSITSPQNAMGGGRDSTNQFKTMIVAQDGNRKAFPDPAQYNNSTGFRGSEIQSSNFDTVTSHQASIIQVKLPYIKNTVDLRSPPQRISQQIEKGINVSESQKRLLENASKTTQQTDQPALTFSDAAFIKKAMSQAKKTSPLEDQLLRNTRFFNSASNNPNNLNAVLWGQLNSPSPALAISQKQSEVYNPSENPRDSKKIKQRVQGPNQPPPAANGIIVKKQYNHQFSNLKTRQQAKHAASTQVNNYQGGEFNQGGGLELQTGPPLVLVNKMNTPINQGPLKPLVQRQSSNIKLDQHRPKGTAHQDSQKSYILSENGQKNYIPHKEHTYLQPNLVGMITETSPSKMGQYNQTPNPYIPSDRVPIQIASIQDYLSPKLLYKKRKRETYKPSYPKEQPQNNVPTAQISLGKNHFLVARETSQTKGGTIASLHIMVNQLIQKNQGSQNPGFILALKNLQNTVNKDPHMAGEALDAIQRAMAAEKYFLPTLGGVGLGRSMSQEVFNVEVQGSQPNGIKESSSQENYLNQLAASDQQHIIQQQITLNNYKNQIQAAKGRVLNATELYELSKQIKYKQYQQAQLGQTSARKNGIPIIASPRGMTSHSPTKDNMTFEERQMMMMDALNVVKLTQKRTVDQILTGGGDTSHLQDSPEIGKAYTFNSKSDMNFEGSKKDMQSMLKGLNSYHQEMISMQDDDYFKKQQEIYGTYGPNEVQSFHNKDNRDTSRNGKQRLKQPGKQDDNFYMQGINQGLSINDSKIRMISSIESIQNMMPHKSGQGQKFYNMNSAVWTNSAYQTLEGRNYLVGRLADNSQEDLSQPLALGFPMTIIGEQVLQQQPQQQQQELQPQQQQQNNNQYIKEFLKNRKQRMSQKQQQLAKISKISDLEKLLYSQPGFEDTSIINANPGGGGRKVNLTNTQPANNILLKRRPEPQISDNENEALAEHPINKTIKMMNILNQLLFKGLKEFNPVHQEILYRCTRYFNFQIPKQFKHEMQTLSKQKDFLSMVREKMYTLFNQHVLRTNGVTEAILAQNQALGSYKYFIGGGNNHILVKQVFKQRSWWNQGEKESLEECNFVWSQWIKERHINALKPYERLEMAQANRQDPVEQESNPTTAIRIYNKIQGNQCISDKKHLFFNMRDLYKERGQDVFSVMPITFVINDGLNDHEFDKFESVFRNIEEQIKRYPALQAQYEASLNNQEEGITPLPAPKVLNNVWIIKPGEDTNRGSGIIVSKDLNEIKSLVRDKSSRANKSAILQKYIENPLLVNKRKFDIRCYGLLTSINGHMLGFFYQDGYLRTSCKEFSVQNLSNRYIHLTNDAIQKHSEDYGKFENANKLSYTDFDRYFAENPHQDYDLKFSRDFLPQIRALVRDTFQAAEKKIDPYRRTNTFEIFGYDFMIDDECKIKLIEVNTNPSLEVCCPLLARIIPSMLDSVFRVAIDPMFQQPPNRRQYSGTEAMNDLKMELVFESPYPDPKDKRPVELANVEIREHHEIVERAEEDEEDDDGEEADGDRTPLVREISTENL